MLSRQNIWFQVALAIVTFLLLWFLESGRVEASDQYWQWELASPASWVGGYQYFGYDYNVDYPMCIYLEHTNGNYYSLNICKYADNSFSYSKTFTAYWWTTNNSNKQLQNNVTLSPDISNEILTSNMEIFYNLDEAREYLTNYKAPIFVQTLKASNDNTFKLSNVKGYVEDNIFQASWTVPLGVGEDSGDMPLLVDFAVTDVDNNIVSVIQYPSSSLPDSPLGTRVTYFDVKDSSLSVDLSKVEGLPTNYRIDYVTLTPYYYDDLIALEGLSLRKGQSSLIYLNYEGSFSGTVQVSPDDTIIPDNTEQNIFVTLSNFFTNFPQMLKNLFVPEAEDIQLLLSDMNDWFSERFGFIWYPFDLAIQVVSAFTMGEADSVIEIPAVTLNMLGGVKLWDAFSVDFDSMGIFEYVRFFTSTILACSIADLAIVKWREWIGGKNA